MLSAAIEGMFLNTELFGHQRGASNKGYKRIEYGTLVLSTQNLHLGNANVNLRFEHGMVSPAYKTYRIKNCSVTLLAEWIKSEKAKQFFYDATTVGASVCRRNVEWETLYDQTLYLPTHNEQQHIAEFLSLVSERILRQEKFIECLKKYKRGLHDRIFSHLSNSECEKTDLRSIATFCGGGTPSKDIPSYWDGNIGWISSSDIHEEWVDTISVTRRINELAINNSATKLCPSGTIAIVSRVGVGKVALMSEDLCTSQDFTNITSIMGNTLFMTYQIAYKMKIEAAKTQGTSIKGITAEEIKSLKIDIPADEEQRYIATLLSSLDIRLRQEKREADCLRTLKKALLQQLFI